jgi:S1-C subfamily serine protease
VTKDGPAEKAGLLGGTKTTEVNGVELEIGGDVITAIDGKPVENMDDLIAYLITDYRPGDEAQLAVLHADGSEETIMVSLGKRPSAAEILSQDEEDKE